VVGAVITPADMMNSSVDVLSDVYGELTSSRGERILRAVIRLPTFTEFPPLA
jgi:hypothetical protein